MAGTVMVRTTNVSSSSPTPMMKPTCTMLLMLLAVKPSIDAAAVMGGAESAGHLWFRGEYDRALTLALRERTFSASFGNFGWTILSNTRLGQIYHSLGDYPKATEALTRTVTLLEGDLKRQTFEAAGLPAVLSRVWLAFCVAECGNAREAAALVEEATAIAEAEDHAYSLVIAHAGTGMLRNLGGDHEGAIAPLERGLVIARLADLAPLIDAWQDGRSAEEVHADRED